MFFSVCGKSLRLPCKLPRKLQDKVDKIINYSKKYKWKHIVFFGRFIPGIRSQVSIPAGINKLKISNFILYSGAGFLIWNVSWIFLGATIGENWQEFNEYLLRYKAILFSIILIFVLYKIKSKLSCFDHRG